MTSYSYTELVNELQNYANRFDDYFVEQIPNFINQGIASIYSRTKSIGYQQFTDNQSFSAGQNFIPRPPSWRTTISLAYTVPANPPAYQFTSFLQPRSYEFGVTYWPAGISNTAPPIFYADYSLFAQNVDQGTSIYIFPTPDQSYSYQLIYGAPPLFGLQYQQNFLTDRYPQLLLFACMVQMLIFLKDDERLQIVQPQFEAAIRDIDTDSTNTYTDRFSRREKE